MQCEGCSTLALILLLLQSFRRSSHALFEKCRKDLWNLLSYYPWANPSLLEIIHCMLLYLQIQGLILYKLPYILRVKQIFNCDWSIFIILAIKLRNMKICKTYARRKYHYLARRRKNKGQKVKNNWNISQVNQHRTSALSIKYSRKLYRNTEK